ncbi:MAG: antirestriction protein [Caldisericia bacterium]|nr:antirestriction protein [Caldisericia bacterium]
MNTKVKDVLATILERFKSGDIPEAIALASYPVADTPSKTWSFTNRTLMFIQGTGDARGFRQWKAADRWVKKGAKAIYILVPCFNKLEDKEDDTENSKLTYFKTAPVFAYEDTEGKPLDYTLIEIPDLPLLDVAKEWGISVKTIPGNYKYYGYFSPTKQEIALASPEETIFFHELAHAAHEKVKGKLRKGQEPIQEIVAELSAQALCNLVGKKANETFGNSFRYIERYAKSMKLSPFSACLKALSETEKVLNLILQPRENLSQIIEEMPLTIVSA